MVRRVIACRPDTDDPAECGMGRGPAVTEAFRACRALFWTGLADVRTDADPERTLADIEDAARDVRIEDDADADTADDEADTSGVLDRTMPGWRRRLRTAARRYRSLLRRRRAEEARLRDRRTATAIAELRHRVPPDLLVTIVRLANETFSDGGST